MDGSATRPLGAAVCHAGPDLVVEPEFHHVPRVVSIY